MKLYDLSERASFYRETFPLWPSPNVEHGWLSAIWLMGNAYGGSGYYGSYPGTYLRRILSLFPDAEHILHLFSGSLPPGNYVRFDLKDADVCEDAEQLGTHFTQGQFDLILADPPYSQEDAVHYGTPMVNRNKVVKECAKVLQPGGFLVWLDQVYPMYRKTQLKPVGFIGIVSSTNHRFRVATLFERTQADVE